MPISLTVVNDLSTDVYPYTDVVNDWEEDGPLTFTRTAGTPETPPAACNNDGRDVAGYAILGTIHVCNKAYGKNGWLGLARIWLAADGHIDAGVALMNDSYLQESGSVYNNTVAWQHVLCQEVGHTFGLDHQKSPKNQSCMNDQWGLTDGRFQSPNQHDYDMLNGIYGPASSGGGGSCNPKSPKCGANVHYTPRAGGGWVITYTFPPGRNLG